MFIYHHEASFLLSVSFQYALETHQCVLIRIHDGKYEVMLGPYSESDLVEGSELWLAHLLIIFANLYHVLVVDEALLNMLVQDLSWCLFLKFSAQSLVEYEYTGLG